MNAVPLTKMQIFPVERRHSSTLAPADFQREYVAANRPVVIENAVPDWPALRKWTLEFFKSEFRDEEVDVSYDARMRMGDFIDGVLASTPERPGPYLYRLFICPHLPRLLPDVMPQNRYSFPYRYASPLMPRVWRRPDGYIKLLIGGAGSRFPIVHYDGDNAHATVTQVYGDKTFVLFAPEDGQFLYPKKHFPNHSRIPDIDEVDAVKFPLFARATRYQTILHPGDMVFIPCGWWHAARVSGPSISIGQNILDGSNWKRFVQLVCAGSTGLPPWKRWPRRLWLHSLGGLFTLRQRWVPPDRPRPRSLLARWSPMFPEEVRDPGEWPMETWTQS
jgi:hypothetical protein